MAVDTRGNQVFEKELHLVIFRLGSEDYGVPIEQVKEVSVTPEIARMPRTPNFIKGVANIRGDIIAILDLETRFGITKVDNIKNITYTLVIESPDFTIGLIVNEVPQSMSIPVSSIDKTPNVFQEKNIAHNFIEGIAKADGGRLIIILDLFKILTSEEIGILQKTEV